jgi:hypothetical protein
LTVLGGVLLVLFAVYWLATPSSDAATAGAGAAGDAGAAAVNPSAR